MTGFTDQAELLAVAEKVLKWRVESLEKDVKLCLTEPFAPFPAILYCFSTIDLLGAFLAGNAGPKAPTTAQAGTYMQQYMRYTTDQVDLLQGIFRHKLVHLASPKIVIHYKGMFIGWRYHHNDPTVHMQLQKIGIPATWEVTPTWKIPFEDEFSISITHLVADIRDSVYRTGGYLESLKSSSDLQRRFETAAVQMYDPSL